MSDYQADAAYGTGMPSATIRDLTLSDEELMRRCELHRVARGGPGGQHANKTATGVRLVHRSGLEAACDSHREGGANRAEALRRLRLALACACRGGADPAWLQPHVRGGHLHCGPTATSWPAVAAVLLDNLAAHHGELKAAAAVSGLSTTQLARALVADQPVRRAADAIRAAAGLPALRA